MVLKVCFISLPLHQPTDSRQPRASFMPPLPRLQPALPIQSHFPIQLASSTCFLPAKSTQSCPTLCDPIDGSPPGSPVPGILQARILEWVAISFSNAWKWKMKVTSFSCVQLSATPWTAAYQAPLSMGFSRQEHWSGCHCLLLLPTLVPPCP